jgi:adenosine deaminase
MPLTVCPLSNVRLRAVDSLADHPLKRMLEKGLKVSIHSDDPAYFGGYLDANFEEVNRVLGLTPREQATLATNSIESSFLEEPVKTRLTAEVDAWLHAAGHDS